MATRDTAGDRIWARLRDGLLVTALLAVITNAGVPPLTALLASRALSAEAYELTTALMAARVAAVERGTAVAICARGSGPEPRCADEGELWTQGWLVYAADAADAEYGPAPDTVLASHAFTRDDLRLRLRCANRYVVFTPEGQARDEAAFTLSTAGSHATPREVRVTGTGRASIRQIGDRA